MLKGSEGDLCNRFGGFLYGKTSEKHLDLCSCISAIIKYKLEYFLIFDFLSYTLLLGEK